jgi:hypothetical protein
MPLTAALRSLPLPQGGSLLAYLIVIAILVGAFCWRHRQNRGR